MSVRILLGHVLDALAGLPADSVHCVVTSPPYLGVRDYDLAPQVWGGDPLCAHHWGEARRIHKGGPHGVGVLAAGGRAVIGAQVTKIDAGQFCVRCGAWFGSLGLEPDHRLYIEHLVAVFAAVHRVLRPDGTCWINIGDTYASTSGGGPTTVYGAKVPTSWSTRAMPFRARATPGSGVKAKDLLLIPQRLAIALQEFGWWVRADIVWAKPNPIPQSARDRPTRSHEIMLLLSKSPRYFYDRHAIAEDAISDRPQGNVNGFVGRLGGAAFQVKSGGAGTATPWADIGGKRNKRSVWTIPTEPFPDGHFAIYPKALVEPCILAGTSEKGVCRQCGAPWERLVEKRRVSRSNAGRRGTAIAGKGYVTRQVRPDHDVRDGPVTTTVTVGWRPRCTCAGGAPVAAVVLDPFLGSGTTAIVADRLQRDCIGVELNAGYAAMAEGRLRRESSLLLDLRIDREPAMGEAAE